MKNLHTLLKDLYIICCLIFLGQFTLRDLYEQLKGMMKMGSLSNLMSMIPGMDASSLGGSEEDAQARIRGFLTVLDSCTDGELDGRKDCSLEKSPTRILRVARGAGVHPGVVGDVLAEYKRFSKMIGQLGKTGLMKNGGANLQQQLTRNPQDLMKKLSGAMDPRVLSKIGGAGNLMSMLKGMDGLEGMMGGMGGGAGGMGDMMSMLGGKMGGKGGMGKRK